MASRLPAPAPFLAASASLLVPAARTARSSRKLSLPDSLTCAFSVGIICTLDDRRLICALSSNSGVGVSAGVGAGASASAGAGASLNASVGLPAVSAGVGASLGASAALPAASASVSAGPGAAPSASGAVAAGGSVSADLSTSVRVNLPSLGGVVLSGLEFGIDAKGSLTGGLTGYSAPDVKQIAHFVSLGSNLIRLPLGWKYLVAGGVCGASELEASYLALIDTYVKASLAASADCRILLDLDTFGHFGGVAVGTGDITIDKLASVYGLLAAKYKGEKRVLFGISNSFAGSVDVDLWAKACQAAVVSIRAAGAVSSAITLGFGARAEFAGLLSIWGDALLGVKDSLNAAGGIAFDFSYVPSRHAAPSPPV